MTELGLDTTKNKSNTKNILISEFMMPAKIGLSLSEAAIYIGISVTKFRELVKAGVMPQPKEIGSRKIWHRGDLENSFYAITSNDNQKINTWD